MFEDEFISFVNENNIKGFLFKKVWDSEKETQAHESSNSLE